MRNRPNAKVKWALYEYECDNCEIGVVQIHCVIKKVKGEFERTDTISGCLDCKKEFGIGQASKLKPLAS